MNREADVEKEQMEVYIDVYISYQIGKMDKNF